VTKRMSRHWRVKHGKLGQLSRKPTTVLLPMRKDNLKFSKSALKNRVVESFNLIIEPEARRN